LSPERQDEYQLLDLICVSEAVYRRERAQSAFTVATANSSHPKRQPTLACDSDPTRNWK